MGWATGSEIANKVWEAIKPCIASDERMQAEVSKRIYEIFTDYDADDWSYWLQEKGSLFETYLRLNEPEEYKEYMKEMRE